MPFLEVEERATPRLSAVDLERAASMKDSELRRLWLSSRIATRIVVERAGGASWRRVPFQIEPSGRPTLGSEGPFFSNSHTGEVALIAVANQAPIGVDLEKKSRSLKMSADRRHRVIEAARKYGVVLPPSASDDVDVLTAWVSLEAAAKALGIGIGRLLTQEGVVGRSSRESNQRPDHGLTVKALPIGEDYLAAIASKVLPEHIDVENFPHADIGAFLLRR